MRLFKMWLAPGGTGQNDMTQEGLDDNVIFLGWNGIKVDRELDAEQLRKRVKRQAGRNASYVADQFVRFYKDMDENPDTLVLVPFKKHWCHVARVKGQVRPALVGDERRDHCRPVTWLTSAHVWRRDRLSAALQQKFHDRRTCVEIEDEQCKKEVRRRLSMARRGSSEADPGRIATKLPRKLPRSAGRRAADLSSLASSYRYLAEPHEGTVFRPHLEFQRRLEKYLRGRPAATVRFEQDHIDVQFSHGHDAFIGEIKVTNLRISVEQAFRAALGQLLEYRYLKPWPKAPRMVMFLDQEIGPAHLRLAGTLLIEVVAETKRGEFRLLNTDRQSSLDRIFSPEGERGNRLIERAAHA
jgi:hypothetical protein